MEALPTRQFQWPHCPEPVQKQVTKFTETMREFLSGDLTGIYLHGSLALGCFNPQKSDLDLLVITKRCMSIEAKRRIIAYILKYSRNPSPIETSFLSQQHLIPWKHPCPFDLHYSEDWREKYEEELDSGDWRHWNDEDNCDDDLAAHITIVRNRGICLWGDPIDEVFPTVPSEHYRASLLADLEWARERATQSPEYSILNYCRVLAYISEGRIFSKDEGAVWAVSILPEEYQSLISAALKSYRGRATSGSFNQAHLLRFLDYVNRLIKNMLG